MNTNNNACSDRHIFQSSKKELLAIIANHLNPNVSILLYGPMGAGKTHFTSQLCKALGVKNAVSSPTYTLTNEYICPYFNILHSDLYRVEKVDDFLLEEIFHINKVSIIEWAQRLEFHTKNMQNYIKIYFDHFKNKTVKIATDMQLDKAYKF